MYTSYPANENDTRTLTRAALSLGATLALLTDAPELASEPVAIPAGAPEALIELAWEATMIEVGLCLLQGRFRVARLLSDAAWSMAHCRRYRASGDFSAARWALARARSLCAEIEALEAGNVPGAESESRAPFLGTPMGEGKAA